MQRWGDFGKVLSLVVSHSPEMTSQKSIEQVSLEWAGSSRDTAQSSPGTGNFQQVDGIYARVCRGEMFLLFDSCMWSDECYLITQFFSCFPSGLL